MNLPLNIDYSGKVVVITGAGGVLCGTMAKAFAQAGAKVAALDLNEAAAQAVADECVANGGRPGSLRHPHQRRRRQQPPGHHGQRVPARGQGGPEDLL